jgi:hypothetical protein
MAPMPTDLGAAADCVKSAAVVWVESVYSLLRVGDGDEDPPEQVVVEFESRWRDPVVVVGVTIMLRGKTWKIRVKRRTNLIE